MNFSVAVARLVGMVVLGIGLLGGALAYADSPPDPPQASEPAAPEPEADTDVDVDAEPEVEAEIHRTSQTLRRYGPVGDSWRGNPPILNPAVPALDHRQWRLGTILDVGVGVEVGDADDFVRETDDLLDRFDDLEGRATDIANTFDAGGQPSAAELEAFLADLGIFVGDVNEVVRDFTDSAYLKVTAQASAPLLPAAVHAGFLRGTLSLDAGSLLEARMAVESVDDAFSLDLAGIDASDVDEFRIDDDVPEIVLTSGEVRRLEPTDNAGVAVQGGIVSRVGLGYSTSLWEQDGRNLYAGTRVNFYHVALVRGGVLFDDDDLEDTARDEFENRKESMNVGIDLGAMWAANRYAVGALVRNINEPSFKYPDTSDSAFFQANPQAKRGGSRWTMDRQFTLQGAVHTQDRRWVASGAIDLNKATDTTGDEYQWAAVMGSFEPKSVWIPSPRVGIRHNLAGEKLTYVTAGASLFRAIHLDVSSTLDTAKFDGDTYPRGLQANLAVGWRF